MATQRQVKAKSQQLTAVWMVMNIAGSYGKEELANELESLAASIEGDELTWNPQWISERLQREDDEA